MKTFDDLNSFDQFLDVSTVQDQLDRMHVHHTHLRFCFSNFSASRVALLTLLAMEPEGFRMRYAGDDRSGTFSSTKAFRTEYGVGFKISHSDYSRPAIEEWLLPFADWDHLLLTRAA
jgi:hypothetical protein|tara:strand:+ start:78314 stop:78664 length:351 start_codon:yes stop_codon:yes gene_type:complete